MYILGINGGVRAGYQDASAVLLHDGELIAAIEEERLTRIKHAPTKLSYASINEVLKIAGISFKDVDILATHGSTWGDTFGEVLKDYCRVTFGHQPKIQRYHHHDCHAASSYYASGFNEAMVITTDASGDGVSTQLAVGKAGKLDVKKRFTRPNSLGIFYAMLTQFCGFTRDGDEYKLMGLAPYGNSEAYDLSFLMKLERDGYSVSENHLKTMLPGAAQPSKQEALFNLQLEEELKFGPRRKQEPMGQAYMDLAASTQRHLEEALVHTVTLFHQETGLRKLCLAGGVALNCAANQKLMNLPFIDEIFVQPASSDAGISLGAAYLAAAGEGFSIDPMTSPYLGSSFSSDEIISTLNACGIPFEDCNHPEEVAALSVASGKVVAWFQGRDEYGPRALGNRSILGNPCRGEMKEVLNQKIKFREAFRPFCPSVIEERAMDYFSGKQAVAPHMTINYHVNHPDDIPSASHVDQTARIQTVNEQQNKRYYEYLKALEKHTGHPVSLNTSFNRNNEPVVNSPRDAISAFFGSGMDVLVLDNFVVKKRR